jgi:nucleoside-diphosphate-sugar epimerase
MLARGAADGAFMRSNDSILVTGAAGFIGQRVVASLLARGFTNVAALLRSTAAAAQTDGVRTFRGNLLSPADCLRVTKGVKVVYHLAAGRGEKSYPDAFLNSVVTTRNLLEACRRHETVERFVNVSSFAVYSNRHGRMLDEAGAIDAHPEKRGQAYCYAKVRQDEMVAQYARDHGLRCVFVRPGVVYGPGNEAIHARVGLGTFGVFLHLGGSNTVPLTYVDNCADAIVLAGMVEGIDGEVFNVVDDDLPTSRQFLRAYKHDVRRFRSLYLPHALSYVACWSWEKYSTWSEGQLPLVYGRSAWHANWKKTSYSNGKLKQRLGWTPRVSTAEGLRLYFAACRQRQQSA